MATPVYCTQCGARLKATTVSVTTYDPYTGAPVITTTKVREHFKGVLHERWTASGSKWTRSER